MLKKWVGTALRWMGVSNIMRWQRRKVPTIVVYHGVIPDAELCGWKTDDMVGVSLFRQHLAFYRRRYSVMPLRELVRTVTAAGPLPPNALAITFDDGYRNNLLHAVPALKELGLTATFFITTGFVDGTVDLWWDRLKRYLLAAHTAARAVVLPGLGSLGLTTLAETGLSYAKACSALKTMDSRTRESVLDEIGSVVGPACKQQSHIYDPLSWEEVRRLNDEGMEIGSHTVTHPVLSRELFETVRAECRASLTRIREETHQAEVPFSYPNGQAEDFTPAVEAEVREAGYYAAVAGFPGAGTGPGDLYHWGRYAIGGHHTAQDVELTLCGAWPVMRHLVSKVTGLRPVQVNSVPPLP